MNLTKKSPLRYPGGKAKLAAFFVKLLKDNSLDDITYIEPYAGGAGVGLGLLLNDVVSNIIINDVDKSIYAFWYLVVNEAEKLCEKIESVSVTLDEWRKQKSYQLNKNTAPIFELGFSTFFLNRTNRSGIINAGMIGGWEQNGDYNLDCRFNKKDLILRIREISKHAKRIKVLNYSSEELICRTISRYKKNTIVFFDPPYYKKGHKLYTNFYKPFDHDNLKQLIEKHVKVPWIVTYDNVQYISDLYSDYRQNLFELNYSAANKRLASEIMIYSHNLNEPTVPFYTAK